MVIVNESHVAPQTRVLAFELLGRLRAQGFTHFAMETLSPLPASDGACAYSIADPALQARGHPLRADGYCTHEPVSAEVVREALRLGFVLVAYEHAGPGVLDAESRERGQAHNLACLLAAQPHARLFVLAGHSHASKAIDGSALRAGWLAARLAAITGSDPLTVDTTRWNASTAAGLHARTTPASIHRCRRCPWMRRAARMAATATTSRCCHPSRCRATRPARVGSNSVARASGCTSRPATARPARPACCRRARWRRRMTARPPMRA